jgi:aspartate 1-decarboxylase
MDEGLSGSWPMFFGAFSNGRGFMKRKKSLLWNSRKYPLSSVVSGRIKKMLRTMLKSKIHRVTLTGCDLNYEGSISIDSELLEAADILPGEQVHVLNVNNGERLVTYAIAAPRGSGTIMLNGPAARCGVVGDILVIITYARYDETELADYRAKVVKVDSENRIKTEQ